MAKAPARMSYAVSVLLLLLLLLMSTFSHYFNLITMKPAYNGTAWDFFYFREVSFNRGTLNFDPRVSSSAGL
jgi:hypothetical protein